MPSAHLLCSSCCVEMMIDCIKDLAIGQVRLCENACYVIEDGIRDQNASEDEGSGCRRRVSWSVTHSRTEFSLWKARFTT